MEKIDELRAKAIASMPSSAVPAAQPPKPKLPRALEEGELSSGPEDAEMPACSASQPDETTSVELFPVNTRNTVTQNSNAESAPTVNVSSLGNVQIKKPTTWKYNKYIKTKQSPFRSGSNQTLGWPGQGSNNNLVISFSDDESGSDLEGYKSERIAVTTNDAIGTDRSKMQGASFRLQSATHNSYDRTKQISKKKFLHPPHSSSVTNVHVANFRHSSALPKDPHIQKDKSVIKHSATELHMHAVDGNVASHNLESLRSEIAKQVNAPKVQNKPMLLTKVGTSDIYANQDENHFTEMENRPAIVSKRASSDKVGLANNENKPMKRLKVDGKSNIMTGFGGQSQMSTPSNNFIPGCRRQVVKDTSLVKGRNTVYCREGDIQTNVGMADRRPGKQCQEADRNVSISSKDQLTRTKDNKPPVCSSQIITSPVLDPGIPNKKDRGCPAGDSQNHGQLGSNALQMSSRDLISNTQRDALNLFPNKGAYRCELSRSQQLGANPTNRVPLETSTNSLEKWSHNNTESMLGINEAIPGSASLFDHSRQINVSEIGNVQLESLLKLEELHDKELEEAQEHRRNCELVEQRTLKAYREAQMSLIEANDRCNMLYRKRELFSAQLRKLIMEASSSVWPSTLHNPQRTRSESAKAVAKANFDQISRLSHQGQVECNILKRLGYESNVSCPDDSRDASHQQRNKQIFEAEECCEPDAEMSEPNDYSGLNGGPPSINRLNIFTDVEEGNLPSDYRSAPLKLACQSSEDEHEEKNADNAELERSTSTKDALDYNLLEASLRSKLVARLGMRRTSKSSCRRDAECIIDKRDENTAKKSKPSALFGQQLQEGDNTCMSEGIEGLRKSSGQSNTKIHVHYHGNNDSCTNHDSEEDGYFSKASSYPTCTTVPLPSSLLHIVSKHAMFILNGCSSELSTWKEKNSVSRMIRDEVIKHISDVGDSTKEYNIQATTMGSMGFHMSDISIDPFWPLCMFELRGKCNDEECSWQHCKKVSRKNSRQIKTSITSALVADNSVDHAQSSEKTYAAFGSNIYWHTMPIPTYLIGSCLIKPDSCLSRTILAQSIWQYWQRGFCASFPLPFGVQRILPPDTPFLQPGHDHIADNDSWKRPLYLQSQHDILKQFMQEPADIELALEAAIDIFQGNFFKPDRKKALSLLSRAIEVDPSSVVLWVVYLHIYYQKESCIGKDDMFFHAVQHNEGSYDLWLMYINSRMQLADRWNAYNYALTTLYQRANTCDDEIKYISACMLDIFLQMIDFLCMCGDVEKATYKIYGLLPTTNVEKTDDRLLSDIQSCFVVSDRCIFWICCIYLAVYRKLPETIVQQFEFEKDLPFDIEWPSVQLISDKKDFVLELMEFAVAKVGLDFDDDTCKGDLVALRSLHMLVINHIRCVAAFEGLHCCADLLAKYLNKYPTCLELVLISARFQESYMGNVVLRGFEEALSCWPKELPGIQCIWNQYAEYALANGRLGFVEELMARWFTCRKVGVRESMNLDSEMDSSCTLSQQQSDVISDDSIHTSLEDEIFSFLNLFLYRMIQKDPTGARAAIDKALQLATPEYFEHSVREHASFVFLNISDSLENIPSLVSRDLQKIYLGDSRSYRRVKQLSRRYYQDVKKPRVRELIDRILGPVSMDCSLTNAVLEVCNGSSLLPEKFCEPKDLVDYVEPLMEITPSNYQLALSVCEFTNRYYLSGANIVSKAILFWASSLLVNALFQAVPAAPEQIWVKAANVLKSLEYPALSWRFHQQAVSVYPFSTQLWISYLDLSRMTDNVIKIVEAAKEKGIDLNRFLNESWLL